jgi:hypothetical protein
MKTTFLNQLGKLMLSIGLLAWATPADAANRTLVLLQENTGQNSLDDALPARIQRFTEPLVDFFVESIESAKFRSLADGHYENFVDLSDTACSRANLLNTLIRETDNGATIDLCVLGHGADNLLLLEGGETLTGASSRGIGTIRSMLTEARTRKGNPNYKFKLRLVYM